MTAKHLRLERVATLEELKGRELHGADSFQHLACSVKDVHITNLSSLGLNLMFLIEADTCEI